MSLLIELNDKFSSEDINLLVELTKLNLDTIIKDLEKGDTSSLHIISENITDLVELLNKYETYKGLSEDFKVIVSNLDKLLQIQKHLDKLIGDGPDSIISNLERLNELYESLAVLPEMVETAQTVVDLVNELKNLSIAVDDAPYGHVASGTYNVETGMLTLLVPQGKQGERGDSIRVRKIYASVSSMNNDFNNATILFGDFVMIHTGNTSHVDTGKIYIKDETMYRYLFNINIFAESLAPMNNTIATNSSDISAIKLRLDTIDTTLVNVNAALQTILNG